MSKIKQFKDLKKIGLYDPKLEKDSCGVALVANLKSKQSHNIVKDANEMLKRMHHRGGVGAEPNTGDGAGILLGLPDKFYRSLASNLFNISLPDKNNYAVGNVFMSHDIDAQEKCKEITKKYANELDLDLIGWRTLPTNNRSLGKSALASEPHIENLFIGNKNNLSNDEFERLLLLFRSKIGKEIKYLEIPDWYICSLSSSTVTYKGQLTSAQLPQYYLDLVDPNFETHMAMVHSRFSTNTFPSWDRAQPNRMLAHNGEINTLRGNKNYMKSREGIISSPYFNNLTKQGQDDTKYLIPVCSDDKTDSGNFDAVLELITKGSSRSIAESMMLLIPEAWQNDKFSNISKQSFYEYNSNISESWDGPAMMAFTDGNYLGALLDRNGLRPSRYYVTKDDHVLVSSEVGVLPTLPVENVIQRGRLEPGKIFLIDFKKQKLLKDADVKNEIANNRPYNEWIKNNTIYFNEWVNEINNNNNNNNNNINKKNNDEYNKINNLRLLHSGGFTTETLDILLLPMSDTGKEALGSMGVDIPLACLSDLPKNPCDYFKQLFAQVTNPPIDPIREEIVMSLKSPIGPEQNILDISEQHCNRLILDNPILNENDINILKNTSINNKYKDKWFTEVVDATFNRNSENLGLELKNKLELISKQAEDSIKNNKTPLIVISHDNVDTNNIAIPSLLAVGAIHQHLVSKRLRTQTGIIMDGNDIRQVHDFCCLLGFGADGIFPVNGYNGIELLYNENRISSSLSLDDAKLNYNKAIGKGILKVMSKMGISTVQSYKGAQIFEAVGINDEVIDLCFTGTNSRINGVTFNTLAKDAYSNHIKGYPLMQSINSNVATAQNFIHSVDMQDNINNQELHEPPTTLLNPGEYHYRKYGEKHLNDPYGMTELQLAARQNSREAYKRYVEITNELSKKVSLRGLLDFNIDETKSILINEVEPVENILKRFVTGAMSLGSISKEAHESLAIAMNSINAKSNTGEGGEDPKRFTNNKRSAIKQVASGRFGVTSNYLANADQIQIKMAQGAKPGEGGELPGHKVSQEIANVRGTTPGVGLISPPPHHDIYSIEDLAQLIHDLKNSNPQADVSVKLVSEVGVGIVASGVSKAKADHITISGGDGGTGAASWTGVHYAGIPWELGLAEAHQTLVLNDLRSRITLQTDGQLKTGRDVVIAGLLGAEEFGFSTQPLIALGCIMMRKCHLNTCPVGIATQDEELRKKFEGLPNHVVNFFILLAEEVREYMALLGFRTFNELIGKVDRLNSDNELIRNYKSENLDLDLMLYPSHELNPQAIQYKNMEQDHELDVALDNQFIAKCLPIIEKYDEINNNNLDNNNNNNNILDENLMNSISLEYPISNLNRTTGTLLSYEISKRFGVNGLPNNTINIKLIGSAGQSLGFALANGITLDIEGDANDYVGKSLSGGKIIVKPHDINLLNENFIPNENVIIGNVCLYGASSGELFARGIAGERFCVRNSGANAVIEGVGDHGCEYMTGGRVVILGSIGRNFAAGMSGGIAFIYNDPNNNNNKFDENKINKEMVKICDVDHIDDQNELYNLIEKHLRYTGSSIARDILLNFNQEIKNFKQIFPIDYANILEKQREEQSKKRVTI